MRILTFSKENKAKIHCPIFDADTTVSSCMNLRDKVWRGERVEVRKGCQACMASCKCPVARTVQRIIFNSATQRDPLGATEEVTLKIEAEVLSDILPVVVQEQYLNRYGVSAGERLVIEGCNPRIEKQLGGAPHNVRTAPRAAILKSSVEATPRAAIKSPPNVVAKPIEDEISTAAATGDMSAAINN